MYVLYWPNTYCFLGVVTAVVDVAVAVNPLTNSAKAVGWFPL